ncbi:MAG: hypothetical protein ACI30D_08060 [Muribaculaceae bacterium]
MVEAREGVDIASNDDLPLFCGKLHDLAADILYEMKDARSEADERLKAIPYFKKLKNPFLYKNECVEYASALNNIDEYDKTEKFLHDIQLEKGIDFSDFQAEIGELLGSAYFHQGKYDIAENILDSLIYSKDYQVNSVSYNIYSRIKLRNSQPDSALYIVNKIKEVYPLNKLAYYDALLRYSESVNDYPTARMCNDSILYIQDEIWEGVLSQQYSNEISNYYNNKYVFEREQFRNRITIWISISVALMLLVICIIFIIRRQIQKNKNEQDLLMAEMQITLQNIEHHKQSNATLVAQLEESRNSLKEAESAISEKSNQIKKMQGAITLLSDSKFKLLNNLCAEYFDLDIENIARNKVFTQFKDEIKNLTLPENLRLIEKQVNFSQLPNTK